MNIDRNKLTPMMKQYFEVKDRYPDCILFFRLGDFYEMFFEDAIVASKTLEIALTGKSCGLEERAPMCGIPFHSANSYISKLVEAGYKVAIGEQLDDPQTTKGIVRRDVIRVVTPGTVLEGSLLENKKNNYLLSLYIKGDLCGLTYVDISTGEANATYLSTDKIVEEIAKVHPTEIIINDLNFIPKLQNIATISNIYINESFDEQYLDESIIIGFHSYNNMQLSFSNATILLEQVDREVILDCSVHGIGIGAGNLNTEIILEYLNENYQGQYNDRNILEINDQFIENIYADKPWGYSLPNYLAAKHQCNTDYAYYLSQKNNLTIDEIDDIFDMLDNEKKVDFDKEYIEQLYLSYFESKDSIIDDFNKVKNIFKGKNVIMICPGKTSETHYNKLASLNLEDYVLVSINFEYKLHPVDYLFVGNSRRMKEIRKDLYKKVIASSNVPSGNVFAKINYSSLLNKTEYVKDNSGLMFLKLLSMCDVNSVKIIGMDGYLHKHDDNYISDDLMFVLEEDIAEQINLGVKLEIKKLKKELSIEII